LASLSLCISRPHSCPPLLPYTTLFRSMINKQELDFGFVRVKDTPIGLKSIPILTEHFSLVVPKNSMPRPKGKVNLHDFKEESFIDRKSTRLNSSHVKISYAVFCLQKND